MSTYRRTGYRRGHVYGSKQLNILIWQQQVTCQPTGAQATDVVMSMKVSNWTINITTTSYMATYMHTGYRCGYLYESKQLNY